MRATLNEAGDLSRLVKIVWPEHTLEELAGILADYMNSENTAVFAEVKKLHTAGRTEHRLVLQTAENPPEEAPVETIAKTGKACRGLFQSLAEHFL